MSPLNAHQMRAAPEEPAGASLGSNAPENAFQGRLSHAVAIATIVGFVAQGLGAGIRLTAILSVVCVGVAYFAIKLLRSNAGVRHFLDASPLRISAIIAISLAAMLGGVLLRQHDIDTHSSVDLAELADTFYWKVWRCGNDQACTAGVISSLNNQVPEHSASPGEQLFGDEALGEIVRTSAPGMGLLKQLYGVDERFLGIGTSLPSGKVLFSDARIPEYLVPNYPDRHEGVVVWKLHPKVLEEDRLLSDVIMSEPPMKPSEEGLLRKLRKVITVHGGVDYPIPPVVRFAQIPEVKYSRCLGVKERHYVFASHLGMLMANGLTVAQSATLSGYSFPKDRVDQDLYIFVFIPSAPQEVTQPSWRHITSNIAAELKEVGPCVP